MSKIQVITLSILLALVSACTPDGITWKTEQLEIHVNAKGHVDKVIDLASGRDYGVKQHPSPLVQIRVEGSWYVPAELVQDDTDGEFTVKFSDGQSEARLAIRELSGYIGMEILSLTSPVQADLLVWGPYQTAISKTIGEIVGVVRDEDFAIGIQALNIRTLGGYPSLDMAYDIFETNSIVDVADSVKVLYRGQTAKRNEAGSVLQAYVRDRSAERIIPNWNHEKYVAPAFDDAGIVGSAIALFGCKPTEALATIGMIEQAEGLPHPMIDGEWGKVHRAATASYLIMNFGEATLDAAMELTHQAGLNYLYHGGPFENWGHFDLNKKEFPDNWESLRRCVDRAEANGLHLGLHTLSNFITTNDPFVTPKWAVLY